MPQPGGSSWHWWLWTTWQPHRHTAEEVHPLLVELQEARGVSFMTSEHVVAVLDAKDPETLVRSWRGDRTMAVSGQHRCKWPGCQREVSAPNAKYCGLHAAESKRRADRESYRRGRYGQAPDSGKVPSGTHDN
jgi:hypothetical protein